MQKSKTLQIAFCISIFIHMVGLGIYEVVKPGPALAIFRKADLSFSFVPVAAPKSDSPQPVILEKAAPIPVSSESVIKPTPVKPVVKPVLPFSQSSMTLPAPPVAIALKRETSTNTNFPATTNNAPAMPFVANVEAMPAYSKNQPPVYPESAQRRGQQGLVLLAIKVTARGSVAEIRVKQSSGFSLLDDAALHAVQNWQFEPAHLGPIAFDSVVDVPVRFKLSPR